MKKALCLLSFLSLSLTILANGKVTLKSGESSVFGDSETAIVTFDYSKAEIEGKGVSLEDFIEQKGYKYEQKWEMAMDMSHKDFIKRFNKKSTGLHLTAKATEEAKYQIVIQVKSIDMGNTAKSLLPVGAKTDGGVVMFGRIIVKDLKGTEVCVMRFTGIQGLGAPAIQARMLLAYQELNNVLWKFLKKSKASAKDDDEDDDD